MPKKLDNVIRRTRRILNVLAVFAILIFISIASIYLVTGSFKLSPPGKDLPAILFASGQVSLFVITIFIGILTLFGFAYFERKIEEAVKVETAKRLATLENEMRGRSFAIQGYVIGENSVNEDFTAPTNEERLREAILYCDQAYNFLKGTGLAAEFLALNNFLGYSCALQDKSRRGYIVACAHRLREAADEHDSPNLLLTYARTILEFSLDPHEVDQACDALDDVKTSPQLNDKQKREANYLASLAEKRSPASTRHRRH